MKPVKTILIGLFALVGIVAQIVAIFPTKSSRRFVTESSDLIQYAGEGIPCPDSDIGRKNEGELDTKVDA